MLAVPSAIGLDSMLAHRLVGCVVGAAAVVAVAWCARLLLGDRVAVVAAAITAFHPTLLAADGSLHAETLFGLCASLALLATLVAVREQHLRAALAAGALAALAALARGEGLFLAVFLALAVASTRTPGSLRRAGALVATCLVLLVPWAVRNWIDLGEPVLISTNDATVLAGANCDATYSGPDIGTWYLACVEAVPFELSEVERSAIWREGAIDYGLDHLSDTPRVAVARLLRIWGLWSPGEQEIIEGRSPGIQQVGISLHAFVVLPLAAAGAIAARRRARLPLRFLAVPIVTVSVTGVLAFGTLRFRHGAEAALAILVAVALVAGYDRLTGRSSAETDAVAGGASVGSGAARLYRMAGRSTR